jgi:hypothetical protein
MTIYAGNSYADMPDMLLDREWWHTEYADTTFRGLSPVKVRISHNTVQRLPSVFFPVTFQLKASLRNQRNKLQTADI